MLSRLVLWSVVLLLASSWNTACDVSSRDLKASTDACIVRRSPYAGLTGSLVGVPSYECQPLSASCPSPSLIRMLSPRILAVGVALSGQAIVWLPLLAWMLFAHRALRKQPTGVNDTVAVRAMRACASALAACCCVHLTACMPLRFVSAATGGRWDASGHTFVYGTAMLPLWVLLDALHGRSHRSTWQARCALVCARAVEILLMFMSATTAAFFHAPSEIAAAWAIVAVCGAGCHWLATEVCSLSRVRVEAALMRLNAALDTALLLWVLGLFFGVAVMSADALSASLAAYIAYDVLVFLLALVLVHTLTGST